MSLHSRTRQSHKAKHEGKALEAIGNGYRPRPQLVKSMRNEGRYIIVETEDAPAHELLSVALDEERMKGGI